MTYKQFMMLAESLGLSFSPGQERLIEKLTQFDRVDYEACDQALQQILTDALVGRKNNVRISM